MTTAILVVVSLLLLVLALIGVLDAVRGTPIRAVVPIDEDQLAPASAPAFPKTVALLTRTTMVAGNDVEVFWNGDQTYPRLWADLRAAKACIAIQLYYCKPGRMADTLREILIERARAGIKVYFLHDAWGSDLGKEYLRELRDAGVDERRFRPLSLTNLNKAIHRAHTRAIVVDGRIAYAGGFGIDDKWFGDGRSENEWRDSNIRFTGPAVSQLEAAFWGAWAETTGDLLVRRDYDDIDDSPLPDAPAATTDVCAGVLHATPEVGSTEAERFLALSIASARERLYITNSYFVPDRDFREMIRAAAKRGVDVRILTAGRKTDVKSTRLAGRARYEELMREGVRIYEYGPTMMHAKTITVDGCWAAVGSMNADNRSLSFNEEAVLLMRDSRMAEVVEEHFLADLEHSVEIDLEEFRRRPLRRKALENLAYGFWRIL